MKEPSSRPFVSLTEENRLIMLPNLEWPILNDLFDGHTGYQIIARSVLSDTNAQARPQ